MFRRLGFLLLAVLLLELLLVSLPPWWLGHMLVRQARQVEESLSAPGLPVRAEIRVIEQGLYRNRIEFNVKPRSQPVIPLVVEFRHSVCSLSAELSQDDEVLMKLETGCFLPWIFGSGISATLETRDLRPLPGVSLKPANMQLLISKSRVRVLAPEINLMADGDRQLQIHGASLVVPTAIGPAGGRINLQVESMKLSGAERPLSMQGLKLDASWQSDGLLQVIQHAQNLVLDGIPYVRLVALQGLLTMQNSPTGSRLEQKLSTRSNYGPIDLQLEQVGLNQATLVQIDMPDILAELAADALPPAWREQIDIELRGAMTRWQMQLPL